MLGTCAVVGVALLGRGGPVSAQEGGGPEDRYTIATFGVIRAGHVRRIGPGQDAEVEVPPRKHAEVLQQLRRYARIEEREPGETLELAALRLGLDPAQLQRMNDFSAVEGAPEGKAASLPFFCASFGHRLLPDEDLELLARLYETEVGPLRALNSLAEGERPEPWSRVLVPFRWRVGEGKIDVRLPVPRWDRVRGNAACVKFSHRDLRHAVQPDDSWESLAGEYHTSAEALRSVHRPMAGMKRRWQGFALPVAPKLEPELRRRPFAHVGMILEPGEGSTEQLVLFLEHFLRVDADLVCRMNDVQTIPGLVAKDEIRIPFARSGGYGALSFADSATTVSGGAGANVSLAVRSKDGVRGFDLELR